MSEAEHGEPAASSEAKTVARSLSWTLIGELGFALGLFLAVPALAKLGSEEALGRYQLGLAVATPVVVLCNLHLRPVWVVDVEDRIRYEHVLALRLLALPVVLLITAAVVLLRGWELETAAVVMLVGAIRAVDSVSDICYARAQRAERMDSMGISRLTRGLLWLAALCLGLVLGGVVLATALVAAVLIIHTLAYDVPVARRYGQLRPRFEGPQLRAVVRLALPMGLAGGMLAVSAYVPTYVLEAKTSVAAVGLFAAPLLIVNASGVLNLALGNAAIPRLAKLAHDDARRFWGLLLRLLGVVALLNGIGVALLWWFGELFLRLAFTAEYVEYLPELLIAGVAALVVGLANILSQTLTSLSRFRLQLVLNVIALVFSCVCAWVLIDAWGLRGAVWSLVALAGFRLLLYAGAVGWAGPRRQAAG